MSLSTTLRKSRTGLDFDVTIFEPADAPDTLAPMVRSFLRYADSARFSYDTGESDTFDLSGWRFTVATVDGWDRDYTFNGVEIVRSGAYRPATVDEIRATMAHLTKQDAPEIVEIDESHPLDIPEVSAPVATDRKAINYRDNARRTLAKAMGFNGNRDWTSAGMPIDRDRISADDNPHRIKPAKLDAKVEAAQIPSSGIAQLTASAIRPHKLDTGMHSAIGSHNK